VFVEVKTSSTRLDPLLSIDRRKLARMRRLAGEWLSSVPAGARRPAIRLDVVAVTLDRRGELVALEQFADVT
jgi:Holliday junction resolvase-like predicted endonuclease